MLGETVQEDYYEKEGLLTHVERSPGGIRQYSADDLERLAIMMGVDYE